MTQIIRELMSEAGIDLWRTIDMHIHDMVGTTLITEKDLLIEPITDLAPIHHHHHHLLDESLASLTHDHHPRLLG